MFEQTNQNIRDKEEEVIQVKHLKKTFEQLEVLKDVSMSLYQGENLVVVGKSGSGKSVLIKCIVNLLSPDSGNIKVLGKKINKLNILELNRLRTKLGFLFQSSALYDSMSVRENLLFPMERNLPDISAAEQKERISQALKNVGLEEAIDKMPDELSGGMKKRIGLARTLIMNPKIIFYDEPTTGLDPVTSKDISNLILTIQKQYNTSSLIITHDKKCAEMTGNRILVLKDGYFTAEGSFEKLSHSDDPFVQAFFE